MKNPAWVGGPVAAAVAAGIAVAAAPASLADTSGTSSCPEVGQVSYTTTQTATYRGDRSTRTYGASGGVLEITLGESVTTGGSITGTISTEANAIFAKASVSVGVTIKKDWTSSVTRGYKWTVPSNQNPGWIEAGHRAYNVNYIKRQIVAPCNVKTVKTGTILGNTANVQFIHS